MPTCRQHQLLARTAHMHKSSTSLWKIRWTTIQIRHCRSNWTLSKQQIKTKSPPQKIIYKHLTTDNGHFTSLHCSKLGETKIGPNLRPQDQSPGASDWLRITWGLRGKELSYWRRGWVFTPACFHTWAAFHKDILSKFLKTFATLKPIQCFCQLQ